MKIPTKIDALLTDTCGYGILKLKQFPRYTSLALFDDTLKYIQIQIKKLKSDLSSHPVARKIYVALNSDPTVNAYAIPRDHLSIISLNAGMCVRLRQLFNFAVNSENVFPTRASHRKTKIFGTAKQLRAGLEPQVVLEEINITPSRITGSDVDFLHLTAPLPYSQARADLAMSLTAAAIDIIAMHEFAHIIRMHRELTYPVQISYFSEAGSKNLGFKKDSDFLQLCEVDADVVGAGLSVDKFTTPSTCQDVWRGWASDPKEALRLWSIATVTTLLLLDGWSAELGEKRDHPHPAVRLLIMIAGVIDSTPDHLTNIDEVIIDPVIASRTLWLELGLPSERIYPFYGDLEILERASKPVLERYHREFFPRLEKSSYYKEFLPRLRMDDPRFK